jgi:hypothetical protein
MQKNYMAKIERQLTLLGHISHLIILNLKHHEKISIHFSRQIPLETFWKYTIGLL